MKLIPVFFCLLILGSCSSHKEKSVAQSKDSTTTDKVSYPDETFDLGVVIDSVKLRSNPAQSFALYLPSDYTSKKKYPVMIFFDPHADGSLPVKKYAQLAEKNDFILMGSNDSKNGLTLDVTNGFVNALINEAVHRFSINMDLITLSGFSGGAKVAMMDAVTNKLVTAVVYCGAAAPVESLNHQVAFIGFAGKLDMNYSEVVTFDQYLEKQVLQHVLFGTPEKHEWPDTAYFKQAFPAIRDGFDPTKHLIITAEEATTLNQEHDIKTELMDDFQSQDLNWWKNRITTIQKGTTSGTQLQKEMNSRLIGFISLACYGYTEQTLLKNDFVAAEKFLSIYSLDDPKNSDVSFFYAVFYAKQGQNDKAVASLNKAINLGMKDLPRIQKEPGFANLQSDPGFQKAISRLHK